MYWYYNVINNRFPELRILIRQEYMGVITIRDLFLQLLNQQDILRDLTGNLIFVLIKSLNRYMRPLIIIPGQMGFNLRSFVILQEYLVKKYLQMNTLKRDSAAELL